MTTLHLVALLLALPLPGMARADCPTPGDLASGIAFARQDGHSGLVSSTDGQNFSIDYAVAKQGWKDQRVATFGIYETQAVIGGSAPARMIFSYAGTPPTPEPGSTWETRIRSTAEWDDGSSDGLGGRVEAARVTYRFLPATEITLSGCAHAVIPVEAELRGDTPMIRHFDYFPALGFGLETGLGDTANGLTLLKAKF
jgi:hypothetical protein